MLLSRWTRGVIAHPRRALLLTLFACGLPALALTQLQVSNSVVGLLLADAPELKVFDAVLERFGNTNIMVAGYEDPALFTLEGLARLDAAVRRVEQLPEVRRVLALTRHSRFVTDADGALRSERLYERHVLREGDLEAFRRSVLEERSAAGRLVSANGRATGIVISFEITDDPDYMATVPGRVRDAFAQAGVPGEVHVGGVLAVMAAMLNIALENLRWLFPIGLCLMVLLFVLLFRDAISVLLPVAVALLSVGATMGIGVGLFGSFSVLTSIVPGLVMVLSFSDVVHILTHYRQRLAAGDEQRAALLHTAERVGTACALTTATTFVGFGALVTVPVPFIRELGVLMAIGICVTFAVAFSFVPAALAALPAPPIRAEWRTASHTGVVPAVLRRFTDLALHRPGTVLVVALLASALSVVGIAQLHIETNPVARFDAEHDIRRAAAFFDSRLAGASTMDLFIDGGQDGAVLAPEFQRALAATTRALEAMPEVDAAVGIDALLATVHRGANDDLPAEARAPWPAKSKAQLAQYLLLLEMSEVGAELPRIIDDERRETLVTLRMPHHGATRFIEVAHRVEAEARKHFAAGTRVYVNGYNYVIGAVMDRLLRIQLRGLLVAFAAISIVLMLLLQSLRLGLLAMVPNLLPLLVTAGALGLRGAPLDIDSVILGSVALGIAVDDTIHFLTRYRFERRGGATAVDAARHSVRSTGQALLNTTVILVVGFAPYLLSAYQPIRNFGALLGSALVVAILADLLLLPAFSALGLLDGE